VDNRCLSNYCDDFFIFLYSVRLALHISHALNEQQSHEILTLYVIVVNLC
jgi:hypothetical protein